MTRIPSDLDDHARLTTSDVRNVLNVSRTKLHELSKLPHFPRKIKMGRSVRWKKSEIIDYLKAQEEARDAS